ncbi:unnamed protein product, partial [Rotaria sordida]
DEWSNSFDASKQMSVSSKQVSISNENFS